MDPSLAGNRSARTYFQEAWGLPGPPPASAGMEDRRAGDRQRMLRVVPVCDPL